MGLYCSEARNTWLKSVTSATLGCAVADQVVLVEAFLWGSLPLYLLPVWYFIAQWAHFLLQLMISFCLGGYTSQKQMCGVECGTLAQLELHHVI